MIAGALIGATGFALLSAVRADTPIAMLVVPFLLIPGGMGLAVPAMTTTVLASVERARAATASAVLNTARQAGGAIGVAAFGALASGARPPDIVSGLHASAYVSAAPSCSPRRWRPSCTARRSRRWASRRTRTHADAARTRRARIMS